MEINKSKQIRNRALNVLALALLVMATVFQSASAQTKTSLSRSTGMIGITTNQTATIRFLEWNSRSLTATAIFLRKRFMILGLEKRCSLTSTDATYLEAIRIVSN